MTQLNRLQKLAGILTEAKSDFQVYHNTYTSAINTAREYAEKQGYEINDEDAFKKIGMGPRKPVDGKTNKFSIELSKDDKPQKKHLHIQVYGMGNKYELNCYIN
jgi:broad specificity phosphatase PhoE